MSQNNSNDKNAMLAKIATINQVEGFDPAPFAVEYTDLNTGESRKRLPVMIQMAWFRMKYPEGRISVQVSPGRDCFVATARVYPSYKDGPDCYLSEATASRGMDPAKPSVSPREWAQTAAVGIALRNAGFGLQFNMAGEEYAEHAVDEFLPDSGKETGETVNTPANEAGMVSSASPSESKMAAPEALTPEKRLEQAMNTPCPIQKYKGKTLGEVLSMDPNAINWIATKFKGDSEIAAAARLICEDSLSQASA